MGIALALLIAVAVGVAIGRATAAEPPQPQAEAGPGPTRWVEDVPVGYERSEHGAVVAAANYTAVLGGQANLDPAFGERAYPLFALPEVSDDLQRRSQGVAGTLADPAATARDTALVLRAAPLGYRVDEYTDDRATISVWYVTVAVGTPELPMATAWGTDRLTLAWADSDWKIAEVTGESGPEPPGGTAPPDPDLAARMHGFAPLTYQAGGEE